MMFSHFFFSFLKSHNQIRTCLFHCDTHTRTAVHWSRGECWVVNDDIVYGQKNNKLVIASHIWAAAAAFLRICDPLWMQYRLGNIEYFFYLKNDVPLMEDENQMNWITRKKTSMMIHSTLTYFRFDQSTLGRFEKKLHANISNRTFVNIFRRFSAFRKPDIIDTGLRWWNCWRKDSTSFVISSVSFLETIYPSARIGCNLFVIRRT